jgi:hypothetical protein
VAKPPAVRLAKSGIMHVMGHKYVYFHFHWESNWSTVL